MYTCKEKSCDGAHCSFTLYIFTKQLTETLLNCYLKVSHFTVDT